MYDKLFGRFRVSLNADGTATIEYREKPGGGEVRLSNHLFSLIVDLVDLSDLANAARDAAANAIAIPVAEDLLYLREYRGWIISQQGDAVVATFQGREGPMLQGADLPAVLQLIDREMGGPPLPFHESATI
jgi:hypothetical protein